MSSARSRRIKDREKGGKKTRIRYVEASGRRENRRKQEDEGKNSLELRDKMKTIK